MQKKYDVIVAGAGASGLMAAGVAAGAGAQTLLIEKMKVCGRKLRITGKGRCNITNIAEINDFLDHIEPDRKFLYQAFSRFFSEELISFFEDIGVKTVVERGKRVFPQSSNANDVVDALVRWNSKMGVSILCNTRIDSLIIEDNIIKGVISGGQKFFSDKVIISTGGCSYPATGSDGFGHKLAISAGHTITRLRPALVPVIPSGSIHKELTGLELKNITVKLIIEGIEKDELFGDMTFIKTGLSGPVILTLSRKIVDALGAGKKVGLSIDLKPALDENKLDARLIREINENGSKPFTTILKNLLPSLMIPFCIASCRISENKKCSSITSSERLNLLNWLKDFRIDIIGHGPFEEAIITAGGINLKEIDPRTMGSKIIKNLFFCGEILDLNADTGGYNLQIAFSTGWVAGMAAAGAFLH